MPLDDPNNPLALEVRHEMAGAYFAACTKMLHALEVLKAFDEVVGSRSLDNHQIARRSELLEHAVERVHYVVIQREAMGAAR